MARQARARGLPRQVGIDFHSLNVVWDVREQGGAGLKLLFAREPSLRPLLEALRARCPVAGTTAPFEGRSYRRLVGHVRSFFLQLRRGVVVFKGTEPLCADRAALCQQAWERRAMFDVSQMDHFSLREDEVYLALTLKGARVAARQTLALISRYARCHGALPRTPHPLFVYALPAETADAHLRAVQPFLTNRGQRSALERTEALAREGLAVYAYYYPGLPLRAAHAIGSFPGSGGIGTAGARPEPFDVGRAVDGWLRHFADLLIAGFLPTTPIHAGNCMQLQNLVVDGGLCDVDSVEDVANLRSQKDLLGALYYSVSELAESVTVLLAEGDPDAKQVVFSAVWDELRDRVRRSPRRRQCDARLLQVLTGSGLGRMVGLNDVW